MNDPVTNVEIEDVLSSIRRLVSENGRNGDLRQRDRSEADSQADKVEGSSGSTARTGRDDTLVLTPALRVPDHEAAEMPASEHAESATTGRQDEAAPDHAVRVDEVDTASEGGGPALAAALESVVRDALDGAMGTALSRGIEDDPEPESGSEDAGDRAARDADAGESLKQRISELETVIAQQEGDWEPDGDSEDAYAGTAVETLLWEDHVEHDDDSTVAPEHVWQEERMGKVEEAELVGSDPDDVGAGPEPVFAHGLSADLGQRDQAQAIHDGCSHEAMENEPSPTAQAEMDTGSADTRDVDEAVDEDVDLFGADPTLIDEETLREMVADIVRQELQGTLGERITRNVRKLVRREIHRALAAHELD